MLLNVAWKLTKNVPRLLAFGAGAGLAWSAVAVDHAMALGPALGGNRLTTDDGEGGSVALYHDESGTGAPVLLVHSVNAAASSYEMRPLFSRLQGERPVWALDLPGFGSSDRTERAYTPELMTRAVVRALHRVGMPAHVVALSLGAEFGARAALERPDLVRSLSFLSPTGFAARSTAMALPPVLLTFPLWSQALYDGVASRASIRFFLSKSFAGPVDELMVDHAYRTAHQPGARHAPLAFLSGNLFTSDAVSRLYAQVTVPTMVLYDRDPFTDFAELPEFIADRSGWSASRIAGTNGLCHWDRPTQTLDALVGHWRAAEAR
ncbi:alpha/beta fold hydrolase [soil metagenome]